MRLLRGALPVLLLVTVVLGGCTGPFGGGGPKEGYTQLDGYVRDTTGRNETAWPNLDNATLTILDNGAFKWIFDQAAPQFTKLTGIKVRREDGTDTAESLKKLQGTKRSGKYDLIWGVDNMLYVKAVRHGDLAAYKPALADRIDPALLFMPSQANDTWFATPADHGFIALNVDPRWAQGNGSLDGLPRLRLASDAFVTENPAVSSPGLGFLLVTIAAYGENPRDSPNTLYDWRAYWRDLFRGPERGDHKAHGCVQVEETWALAYEQHYSAGYGVAQGGQGDKPIVVSYSQSPAYEAANGMNVADVGTPLVANGTTYHQVQTIAIANGTKNLQAAQAWVEFTLTDFFQELTAGYDVMYPAVKTADTAASVDAAYHGLDPPPGSFRAVELSPTYVADNVDRWVTEWREMREDPTVNCKLAT